MKVSIKGARGSMPTSGPDIAAFGGSTSCITVEEAGCLLILDGGTGIQKIDPSDSDLDRIDILLTHLHLDHIQGLGFFKPLFDPEANIHLWAPRSVTDSLHTRLSRYLSPPLFPVLLRDLPCQLELHDIADSDFEIGPFGIQSQFVIHTGPTVGFRVKGKKATLAYMPDHEPALGPKGLIPDPKWISGFDLACEADLLIHDAQYTSEEYKSRKGWGHSSMEDALSLAKFADAKHLLLTHHDPSRTDAQLERLQSKLAQNGGSSINFAFAREGMELELGGD